MTFFLTGSGAGIQMSGQANWHLVAPVAGPMAGFVIFLDPNGPRRRCSNTSLTSVPIPAGLKMRTGGRLWLMQ